ncbi:hypothetical protein HK097_005452, partial [Rhizophlyctis rosea]
MKFALAALALVVPAAMAQSPLYGQCGGQGWSGATTCSQGVCTYSNAWYSQCLPGSSNPGQTTRPNTTTTHPNTTTPPRTTTTTRPPTPPGTPGGRGGRPRAGRLKAKGKKYG